MPTEDEEPQVVYHYTSMDTMTKIVQSASIWATSISYLNDTTEGEHFVKLIRDRLPAYRKANPAEDDAIFNAILQKGPPDFDSRPFVASFSREADSLPQWRSYCPNGNGVAIGFRVECLKRAFVEKRQPTGVVVPVEAHITFRKVEYLDESTAESFDDDIRATAKLSRAIVANRPGGVGPTAEIFKIFIELEACFKKHLSFSNEREYRLAVDPMPGKPNVVEFRPTRSSLVPYIPVSIPREDSLHTRPEGTEPIYNSLAGRWQFIDRVVIGPTPNKALSIQAVHSFFRKHSMYVEVEPSHVPYRDW
jgi:hypothetical protein